jgi:hypothetical protein
MTDFGQMKKYPHGVGLADHTVVETVAMVEKTRQMSEKMLQ